MPLLAKPLAAWNQPRRFREQMKRLERRVTNWWLKPTLALLLAGMFLFQWYLATLKDGPTKPLPFETIFPFVLAGSFLMIYGTGWLTWMLPSRVSVFEQGFREDKWFMQFENMAAHAWFPAEDFSTLLLVGKDGYRKLLGVPSGEVETKLRAILAEKKVVEDSSLKPFSEAELKPTVAGGLLTLAPVLVVAFFVGMLGTHAVLISHLKREMKSANEESRRDWQTMRTKLIRDVITPERLPVDPPGEIPASAKVIWLQRYLVFAPLVYLCVVIFLSVLLVKYWSQSKNLQRLLDEKKQEHGRPTTNGQFAWFNEDLIGGTLVLR